MTTILDILRFQTVHASDVCLAGEFPSTASVFVQIASLMPCDDRMSVVPVMMSSNCNLFGTIMSEPPLLAVRDVSCSLRQGQPIFEGINLTVNSRDVVVLSGKSGGGKVRCLLEASPRISPVRLTLDRQHF